MQDLEARMETSLEAAIARGPPIRKYSSRDELREFMVGDHSVYSPFVSGASNGLLSRFHCQICWRDVSMQSRGAREFIRQFSSDKHWLRDVAYRVQKKFLVFNRLMEPLVLTTKQRAEYLNQDAVITVHRQAFSGHFAETTTRICGIHDTLTEFQSL